MRAPACPPRAVDHGLTAVLARRHVRPRGPHSTSLQQAQQPYPTMDAGIKAALLSKLKASAPKIGLPDFSFPSFVKEVREGGPSRRAVLG